MATDALSRTDKSKRRPVTPHLPHLKPLSSRGQFQSGQPEAGVPRRWAGREMAKNFFGHAPMQQFLSIAFPSVAYVAPDEDDLNRYKTLLRAIPAGLNILERDMYGPLVTAVTDIAADVSHQLRIDNSSSKRGEVWPGGPTLTPDVTIHTLDTMEKSWAHGISFLEVKRTTKEDPLSLSEDSQSISLHNALNDYGKGGLDTTACRPFRPDAKARRLVRDGYNKALKTRIMEEYKPLTPGKDYVDEDCQLTHQNFLSAIDKALGEGEWPQEDKAQVFTPAGRPKNEDNKEISRMLSSNISQVLSPLPFADSNLGSPPSNRSPRAGEIGSAANHLETRSHAPVQVLSESSTGPGMAADPRSSCPAPSQSGNATIPPTRGGPEEPAAASSSKMRSKSGDVLSRPMSEPSATSGRPSAAGGSQASSQPGNTLLPMSSSAQSKLSTVYSSATRSRSDALLSVALRNSESRRNLPSRSTALVAPEAAQVGAEPRSPLVAAGDVPLLSGVPQPAHSSPPRVSGSSQSVWRRSERTSDAPLDTSSKVLRSREGLAGSSSGAGGTRSVHSSRSQGGASSLKRRGEQSSGSAKPSWK
ncbi:hypothetical protein GLOTRDRAFT_93657 [Gloeophyllum trabeum ATCC 11539]|uniref:Uncharacterized protein n=1 Tax=Gloeophyllum trabeum (strain ATCC 11539 / FP-39264 / Madison 617) TaxID=670483 RepID=S7RL68_GLOTA|nr:uncharacterized protein GLOTRDRAFT_93657 [Gloeophyllum trabeum ATCC 11539]EPQ55120.1 hypothetical protein GLOTRDRAFT_93657 [Gloeophyllum trabeum ATCC 11539]